MDITQLIQLLHIAHPNPQTELKNWSNPIQFMVSVMLSAQATDVGVNKATPKLFEKYVTAKDFANADLEDLITYVKSINFYRNKSERIIKACEYVDKNLGGELPPQMDQLIKIPGIGRKSANVIINEALNGSPQGIVVDTHMIRLAQRLKLSTETDPEKIEQDLMKVIPQQEWKFFSSSMVLHGRYVCKSKKPKCEECVLNKICPSAFKV